MPDRKFQEPYPRAECIVAARKPDARWRESLTTGKVYEIHGELRGMWAVLDNANEIYLYAKSHFRVLEPEPPTE